MQGYGMEWQSTKNQTENGTLGSDRCKKGSGTIWQGGGDMGATTVEGNERDDSRKQAQAKDGGKVISRGYFFFLFLFLFSLSLF